MKFTWDLSDLFENDEAFYGEIEDIKKKVTEIKKYEHQELDESSFLDMLNEQWAIKEHVNTILVYGSLRYYKNIHSKECIELKQVAEMVYNQMNLELSFLERKILGLGKETVKEFLVRNHFLEQYRFYLENLFRMQEHVQDEHTNVKIKNNIDRIGVQLQKYNNALRDICYGEILIDGRQIEITSSNVVSYLASNDRETRKQTYFVVNQTFKDSSESFARILDLIFGYRIENANLETYDSVLQKVLFEENIDVGIVESLIQVVNTNLNLMQDYLKIKSDVLGIQDPHLYDFGGSLNADLKIKYSFEEAVEIIKGALKPLGEEYLNVVDFLFQGHVDAEADENKHQSIVFSWNTYSFLNFKGTYGDLKNLVHELGHIVHYALSQQNVPYLYEDSSVFVGEIASIVNELLLNRYLYVQAKTNEEKLFYLSKEIENYITSVFKQTMYTEFENLLYQAKRTRSLTAEFLSENYFKILQKYFGETLSYDDISSIEWTRLGHLYRWSYYPYKYATGLILASIVVYSLIDDHSLSNEQYIKFLSAGSSQYSLDLLKMLNIEFTDLTIIHQGFHRLEEDIRELKKVLKEL